MPQHRAGSPLPFPCANRPGREHAGSCMRAVRRRALSAAVMRRGAGAQGMTLFLWILVATCAWIRHWSVSCCNPASCSSSSIDRGPRRGDGIGLDLTPLYHLDRPRCLLCNRLYKTYVRRDATPTTGQSARCCPGLHTARTARRGTTMCCFRSDDCRLLVTRDTVRPHECSTTARAAPSACIAWTHPVVSSSTQGTLHRPGVWP
jgi:hypothetical protein